MNRILFQQTYSRALRFWHWATVIVVGLVLFTVLVNKTFLNWIHVVPLMQESLSKSGALVTDEQSFKTAGALRDHVWTWHIKFGYVLSGLLLFRAVLEFFQPQQQKLFHKIKTALFFVRKGEQVKTATHQLVVKIIYLLFYGLLTTIVVTGLLLVSGRGTGQIQGSHSIRKIHEACFNFLLLFIFVHVIGVIRAERKNQRNIVSAMINGGKTK